MREIHINILAACLISLINFGSCIPIVDQISRGFLNFPRICNFGFKRRSLHSFSSVSVNIENSLHTDSILKQTQFWSPLNYSDISKRAERHFADSTTSQSDSCITTIYLVPKSSFEDFKRCNVSSLSLSILDTMGVGHSLMKVPTLVNGGSKLHTIPVVKPITVSDSSVPQFIVENMTVLFYDHDALVTDGSFSTKNHKLFDSIWASANFQSSSPSCANDSSTNNTTDYNFVMFNNSQVSPAVADALSLSWALNSYKFNYFKYSKDNARTSSSISKRLIWPENSDRRYVLRMARAYTLMKDLADTPALSLGPEELQSAAVQLAEELQADNISVLTGVDQLIEENYPQIAAVGMGAEERRAPRIINIRWDGPKKTSSPEATNGSSLPLITIIGKGITFDTGGLNIKTGGGMRTMKRDMAGAAQVTRQLLPPSHIGSSLSYCDQAISLALLLIDSGLDLRLLLLLPIAENSISGGALRPGDVIRARNGKTTEITNTDAEGRLILADALVRATEDMADRPALVVDFATLTGAARVALGNDLPALFSNNMDEMMKLWNISMKIGDPMWIMPLWEPMKSAIKASAVADLVNAAEGFGGAITAALYLSEFIVPWKSKNASSALEGEDGGRNGTETIASEKGKDIIWFHIDFMGSKNGHAEPQGMAAVLEYIKKFIIN